MTAPPESTRRTSPPPLSRRCPQCGDPAPPDFAFCWSCGRLVDSPVVAWRAAGRGQRALAAALDLLPGLGLFQAYRLTADPSLQLGLAVLAVGYLLWVLALLAQGDTPGKRMLGLRVVRRDGRPVGLLRHLLLRTPMWWGCTAVGVVAWVAQGLGGRNPALTVGLPELTLSERPGPDEGPGPLAVHQGQALHDVISRCYVVAPWQAQEAPQR